MRRSVTLFLLLGLTVVLFVTPVSAQEAAFAGGGSVDGDAYTFAAGPFALVYQDTLYEYATGEDGQGYYTTYVEGEGYTDWGGWADQPADFQWQPTAVDFNGNQYVFYNGTDGGIYHNAYDGSAWSGWENLAGEFTFPYAPFANAFEDGVYLYAVTDTGDLHYKVWSGGEWSAWEAINEEDEAGPYQPYALDWDGYENVFWTGADGTVYWNRYDGEEWSGARALPDADDAIAFGYSPFAVGYEPEEALYAYAISEDGAVYFNVFEGDAWSGWETVGEAPAEVKNQPSVSVYDGVQHMVYTGEDGHAYYVSYDGDWGDWQDLGDNYAYDPFQYEYEGNLYLTYVGTDGEAYVKPYGGGGDEGPAPAEEPDDDY